MSDQITRIVNILKLNFCGLLIGFILFCFSLTPSLLPRPVMFAGAVAGLSFAIGYGIGVFISWLARRAYSKPLPAILRRYAWRVLLAGIVVIGTVYAIRVASWQNEVRRLIEETEFQGQQIVQLMIVAFLSAAILILVARLVYRLILSVGRHGERWLPRQLSYLFGTILVTLLLVWFFNGVLFKAFVNISNDIYRSTNDKTHQGAVRPESPLRSGSPASLAAWDTLGRQGRSFVGTGPTVEQLADLNGQSALQPIRVYIGVQTASTATERAAMAVAELERTGAFERSVLCVMIPTGTGWIEAQSADSLEYIWNGDTALVSTQYSYLPSWISFLVDKQNAADEARALFDAVYDKWKNLSAENRPKLIVYGLSLGSLGIQGTFSGADDIENRTDGALFVGTPNDTPLWRYFTQHRDRPSPQWQPVYQQGRTIRFAATSQDLQDPGEKWTFPRALYLQHASDSVVWWSPSLIWHEPDWLKEPRGSDVSPTVQWYPFVTFFQVTVDQFFGTTVPNGHGHNYADSIVAAWNSIVPPEGWSQEKTEKLQAIIDTYPTKTKKTNK